MKDPVQEIEEHLDSFSGLMEANITSRRIYKNMKNLLKLVKAAEEIIGPFQYSEDTTPYSKWERKKKDIFKGA